MSDLGTVIVAIASLITGGVITGVYLTAQHTANPYRRYHSCKYCQYFSLEGKAYSTDVLAQGYCQHRDARNAQYKHTEDYYCGKWEIAEALGSELKTVELNNLYRKQAKGYNKAEGLK